ncbi:MAG: GYF domain-containing protein [Alphaproteobacteria bacterium]|nr:GYF domain-containing protein [Alphaproteobacteria bacterium]
MDRWHVSINNSTEGPLTEESVRKRVEAGEFSKGSLVWKKGLKTWEPIELHFNCDNKKPCFSAPASPVDEPAISLSDTQPTPVPIPAEIRPSFSYSSIFYFHVFTVFLLFGLFYFSGDFIATVENPSVSISIWGGILLAATLNAVLFLRRLWRISSIMADKEGGFSGGKLKLFCAFSGVALIVFCVATLSQASTIYRVSQARKAFEKYILDVDPVADTITISGVIGPHLGEKLERLLSVHTNTQAIVITSPGGLTDEALKAAEVIEKHHDITLIARKTCNSSCLLIFMSGEKRLADYGMSFGFHGTSAITDIDESLYGLAELNEQSSAYLIKRGVPRDIVIKSSKKTGHDLDVVSAIRLADEKVISGLLDGNAEISLHEAKWKKFERIVSSYDDPKVKALASVISAISSGYPSIVKDSADDLYRSLESTDPARITQAVRAIIHKVIPKAMMAADGDVLLSYMNINLKQIEYLRSMEEWSACSDYLNGNVGKNVSLLSQSMLEEEFNSLADLIKSAASKRWTVQPIPKWAEKSGESLVTELAEASLKKGMDIQHLEKNPKDNCIWTYALFKLIINEGPVKAPPILRWLISLEDK